jgi:AcrR family transcriptional regulator
MTTDPTPPTRRLRNPRGGGAALGLQIVAAALDAVDHAGVQGLTLRGLARSIGVSAPAIYAHFADIDAILLAVSERAFADLAGHLAAAVQTTAPAERLRAVCRAYLDYAEQHPGRYQVMFGGQWDATSAVERSAVERHAVEDLGSNVIAVFSDALRAGGSGTSEGDAATATAAVTTWVLLHGYAHQRLVARAFPWPPHMTEHVLDSVVSASPRR